MSHPQRQKHPLDVLQGMINAIVSTRHSEVASRQLTKEQLIETGKALRVSDKDGGRTMASSNARLRLTIPNCVDVFHQALDELESDIVRPSTKTQYGVGLI